MLSAIQDFDARVSQAAYDASSKLVPSKVLHAIGWSGEGYFWLSVPLIVCLYYKGVDAGRDRFWSNMLLINLVDIVFIALGKCTFKRPRPAYEGSNKTAMFLGPDQHSFPSGHTSRVWSIYFVVSLLVPSFPYPIVSLIWAVTVSLSRLLVGRHYIGDLVGGFLLALLNFTVYKQMGPISTIAELWPFGKQFLFTRV
eukprot:TRINITY_DN24301_c0_g1_i1.p1 TRINITY_DN24301_c0_g1~~TRINITY_DN24301_c0_g1_i1.p1  ORF type:complete len:213 (+),score=21.51 TRINITY_DN24301_c0_g1_i1:50-640(+)